MKPFVRAAILAVGAVAMAVGSGCGKKEAKPAAEAPVKTFKVALKPDKNPDAMMEERQKLAENLSQKLGRPVEVVIPVSGAAILEGLGNGTIDLAYLSATDMVKARDKGYGRVLLAGEIDGKTTYESYWICLADRPYTKVEDLKGKKVAFSSRTSTSGGIVPLHDLFQKGLIPAGGQPEAFFGEGNVWFGSGYVSAAERVLNGEAEAAAVSYYVLDKDKHLSPEQRARLKKVCAQGPVPTHVLVVRGTLPAADQALLKEALLAMNAAEAQALRDRVFTSKLVEVDEAAHLAPLQEALQSTAHLHQ